MARSLSLSLSRRRDLSLSVSHRSLSRFSVSRNPYLPKNPSLSTARSLSLSHRSLCHRSLSRTVDRSLSSQILPLFKPHSKTLKLRAIRPTKRRRRHRHHRKQIPPPLHQVDDDGFLRLRGDLWRSVYLAAVLEYLAAECLRISLFVFVILGSFEMVNAYAGVGVGGERNARDNKKTRVVPRHIRLAVRNDEELKASCSERVTIASGGVMPNIHNLLLPKKTGGGASNRYPCELYMWWVFHNGNHRRWKALELGR
ncbi:hypothetical protein Syun_022642 [Stephania yunnanensis]|uniref:Histone H2A C-terminal domain-containing protein n=1 Tax=Stephania yunnanensis TaxID=152371 RepID=A0AAP0F8B7_9MAGN